MKFFVPALASSALAAYKPTADVITGTDACKDAENLQDCMLALVDTPFSYTHTGDAFDGAALAGCDADAETRKFVNGPLKAFTISDAKGEVTHDLAPAQILIADLPASKQGKCTPIGYIGDATTDCPDDKATPIKIDAPVADAGDSTGNSVIFVSADLATADASKSLILDLTDCFDTGEDATNEQVAYLQYTYAVKAGGDDTSTGGQDTDGAASTVAMTGAALLGLAALAL